ncbi:methyltransferase [Candidatus Woesearchaeota archaeon]|nr:methyltransferase [Candidatus Woesearchaeota archaeon]
MSISSAFFGVVSPYLVGLESFVLVDCCAGDGKAGAEFYSVEGVEKIIFVDVYEPNKFKKNTQNLKTPFEVFHEGLENFPSIENAVYIGLHSCGELTDLIIEKAVSTKSVLAVMPCCYNQRMKRYDLVNPPDNRKLLYEAEKDYFDAFRIQYLKEQNCEVFLERIDKSITPMNNVIIAKPFD